MLATPASTVPEGREWAFEPKYDGVRVIAEVGRVIRLVTRKGNDKSRQFPEVTAALAELRRRAARTLVLDGELVALVRGAPARFQALQGRVGLQGEPEVAARAAAVPAALVVFDILRDGREWLLAAPWSERRARLAALLREYAPRARHLRLAPATRGRGEAMLARARREGWEGVIAKRTGAPYTPGVRSDAWLKLKIEFRQEFVIGGFTAPRNTRQYIGALLLGYFDSGGRLVYAGHTGGGFTRAGLEAMYRRLRPLIRSTPPFAVPPKTNEAATWVRPEIVVEVKFNEWTADGRLRQPIFVGIRDDKDPREVRREPESVQRR